MRIIAVSISFALIFLSLILLSVGSFTKVWWVTKDKKRSAGLWERCDKSVCYDWEKSAKNVQAHFDQQNSLLPITKAYKEWQDQHKESMKRLDVIRACVLTSLCASLVTTLLLTIFIHFIRRKTSVQIACWLKAMAFIFNIVVTVTSLLAAVLASEYRETLFLNENIKFGGSWICVVVACVLSVLVSVLLVATFMIKEKQPTPVVQSQGRKRKFTSTPPVHTQLSTEHHVKGNRSPPFVIPTSTVSTTPYHNHPYVQYFADQVQPHYVDGCLEPTAEGYTTFSAENIKMTLADLSDYSGEPYADLAMDDTQHGAASSYSNLTHSYDDLVSQSDVA